MSITVLPWYTGLPLLAGMGCVNEYFSLELAVSPPANSRLDRRVTRKLRGHWLALLGEARGNGPSGTVGVAAHVENKGFRVFELQEHTVHIFAFEATKVGVANIAGQHPKDGGSIVRRLQAAGGAG